MWYLYVVSTGWQTVTFHYIPTLLFISENGFITVIVRLKIIDQFIRIQ